MQVTTLLDSFVPNPQKPSVMSRFGITCQRTCQSLSWEDAPHPGHNCLQSIKKLGLYQYHHFSLKIMNHQMDDLDIV